MGRWGDEEMRRWGDEGGLSICLLNFWLFTEGSLRIFLFVPICRDMKIYVINAS
ncbi:MAG: hypothetical protein F6K36_19345 [Symploca sp. SIO3C6]|nr:hypothetical protein [Symploca sp. SIO3C6]